MRVVHETVCLNLLLKCFDTPSQLPNSLLPLPRKCTLQLSSRIWISSHSLAGHCYHMTALKEVKKHNPKQPAHSRSNTSDSLTHPDVTTFFISLEAYGSLHQAQRVILRVRFLDQLHRNNLTTNYNYTYKLAEPSGTLTHSQSRDTARLQNYGLGNIQRSQKIPSWGPS